MAIEKKRQRYKEKRRDKEKEEEGQTRQELFASAGLLSFFKKALTIKLYCSQGETSRRENELRRRRGAPS